MTFLPDFYKYVCIIKKTLDNNPYIMYNIDR